MQLQPGPVAAREVGDRLGTPVLEDLEVGGREARLFLELAQHVAVDVEDFAACVVGVGRAGREIDAAGIRRVSAHAGEEKGAVAGAQGGHQVHHLALGRDGGGDDLAVDHHGHVIGQSKDGIDVVLDEHHGVACFELSQQLHHALGLGHAHAGHRHLAQAVEERAAVDFAVHILVEQIQQFLREVTGLFACGCVDAVVHGVGLLSPAQSNIGSRQALDLINSRIGSELSMQNTFGRIVYGLGVAAISLGSVAWVLQGQNATPNTKQNPNFQGTVNAVDDKYKTAYAHYKFEPGSRTKWHSHSGGQVILVPLRPGKSTTSIVDRVLKQCR